MGRKQRQNTPFGNKDIGGQVGSAYEDKILIDTQAPDYVYDEVDQFNQKRAKLDVKQAASKLYRRKTKQTNVLSLGLGSSSEEEDNEEEDDDSSSSSEAESDLEAPSAGPDRSLQPFMATDDIIDEEEDRELDDRAWGKDKKAYYGSNVNDQIRRKRATHMHLSEVHDVVTLELEAGQAYQKRLADGIKNFEYKDLLGPDDDEDNESSSEEGAPQESSSRTISTEDTDSLSTEQKLKRLKQMSPTFIPLTNDALKKNEDCVRLYEPILAARSQLGDCPGLDYVVTKWRTCRNYVLHVLGYALLLNTHGHDSIKTHPVMETLAAYRYLFKKQEAVDAVMRPQLEALVQRLSDGSPLQLCHTPTDDDDNSTTGRPNTNKRMKSGRVANDNTEEQEAQEDSDSDSDGETAGAAAAPTNNAVKDDARREIGKVITKNRGLMPSRKRAVKNPRIKYKTKYADKVKRRKGQVREVLRETTLYRGEKSGINPLVVKSRKLK